MQKKSLTSALVLTIVIFNLHARENLLKNNLFNGGSSWHKNTPDNFASIDFTDKKYKGSGVVVLNSSKFNVKAYISQRIKPTLSQGQVLELSLYYKTESFNTKEVLRLDIEAKYNNLAKTGKMWQKIRLKPSKKWTLMKNTITLKNNVTDVLVLLDADNFKGKVFFAKPSLKVLERKSKINPKELYVWKEAEDVDDGGSLSTWRPAEEKGTKDYFSGKGASTYAAPKGFHWSFEIKRVADLDILEAKKITYYIWYRLYGFRQGYKMTTRLDKRNIATFNVKGTEKVDENNKYLGGGTFYWQQGGSFTTTGGRHDLDLVCDGKTCIDAIIVTTDKLYQPRGFEAREHSQGDFIKDCKADYVYNQMYSVIGINDKLVSLVTLRAAASKPSVSIPKDKEPAVLHITLPDEVILENVHCHWASSRWHDKRWSDNLKFRKVKEREENGKTIIDYEAYFYYVPSWDIAFLSVRAKPTTFKVGKIYKGTYYFEYQKSKQTPQIIRFHSLDIKPAKAFKKIFIGPSGRTPDFYFEIPGIFKLFKYGGFNAIRMSHFLQVMSNENLNNIWKAFSKKAKENKIIVINNYSPFHDSFCPDEHAVDIDGKTTSKPSLAFDETGKKMARSLKVIKDNAAYGVSGMAFDDENFFRGYDKYDYHPRMSPLFKEYLKKYHPKLSFKDPRKIVKDKKNNPALYEAWFDFKCYRNALKYKYFRAEYDKNFDGRSTFGKKYFIPIIGTHDTLKKEREMLYWDLPTLEKYVTHISQMIYTFGDSIKEAVRVGDELRLFNSVLKKPILAPTLLAGDHIGYPHISKIKGVKYQFIEAMMNKAKGVFYWDASAFFNFLVYRQISEGIRMLSPYEDIILNGTYYGKAFKGSNGWERIMALKYKKQVLLYVANYLQPETEKTVISMPDRILTVKDLSSGNNIAIKNNRISFDFKSDRGRIFYLESK